MDLHGGNIYKIAKEYNIKKEEIMDFSQNKNPLGLSEKVKIEIINNLDIIQNYPDPDYLDLRNALAEYNASNIENILIGNGATELIYLFARIARPKTALIISPTFVEYHLALNQTGSKITYYRLKDENEFKVDLAELKEELKKSYDLLIICNPNNPTSTFLEHEGIEEIISWANKTGTLIMIDESFIEFVDQGLIKTFNNMYKKNNNVFI